ASSVFVLLSFIARELLQGGAGRYGVLVGSVALRAIVGAAIMPRLLHFDSADGRLLLASLMTVGVMALLAFSPPKWLAICTLLVLGAAWITALTTLNGVAQAILPNWVRGRSLAVYLTVFNGAMTGGSLSWGATAAAIGVPLTLIGSA